MKSELENIKNAAEGLLQSLQLLLDLKLPKPRHIPESFFEIWVANELIENDFEPSFKKDSKEYDILLSNGLKIEVKGSKKHYDEDNKLPWWGYSFRKGDQVRNKKFNFCILVRANDDGMPQDYFILDIDEFKIDENFIKREDDEGEKKYFIELSDSYADYAKIMKKWEWEKTALEEDIHNDPKKFKNVWKKIRK